MKRNTNKPLVFVSVAALALLAGGGIFFSRLQHQGRDDALYRAAGLGQTGKVTALLDAGANANTHEARFGTTPLHAAVASTNITLIQALLQHGAQINATNKEQFTPLMFAAMGGQPTIAKFLLSKGADPLLHNKFGRSALQCAQGPLKLRSLSEEKRGGYQQCVTILRQAQAARQSNGTKR